MRSSGSCLGIVMLAMLVRLSAGAAELPRTHLTVVGSLGGTAQYRDIEEPFWAHQLAADSNGRVTVDITPFDRSGLKGYEALQMARLGVISFLTVPLSAVSSEDPEANAPDLPGLNPSIESVQANLAAYRPVLAELYRSRYGLEALALFSYPAQVLFCKNRFATLNDLAGRNIRVASGIQATLVNAVGAHGIVMPFNEMAGALADGRVECAITGTLTGNSVGLHKLTHYIHALPINWGVQIVAANRAAWWGLTPAVRGFLTGELADLEHRAWAETAHETAEGFACSTGQGACTDGTKGDMVLVPVAEGDRARLDTLLRTSILPKWAARCGQACTEEWNRTVGAQMGLTAAVTAP